jgi:hypothetical protein
MNQNRKLNNYSSNYLWNEVEQIFTWRYWDDKILDQISIFKTIHRISYELKLINKDILIINNFIHKVNKFQIFIWYNTLRFTQQAFICKFSTNIQFRMKFGRFSGELNQFGIEKRINRHADSASGTARIWVPSPPQLSCQKPAGVGSWVSDCWAAQQAGRDDVCVVHETHRARGAQRRRSGGHRFGGGDERERHWRRGVSPR